MPNWLRSYLSNRQQFVKMGDCKSNCLNISRGVPQGSVLGSKLFNLYINDICRVSYISKYVLFADDTNIFCSGENLQLLDMIITELNKLKTWFHRNKLSLNLNKTKIMLFGNCNTEVKVSTDNVNIERVYENKFLGVILDHRICWKSHIEYIRSKLPRNIAIMGKSKFILDQKSSYILYCSLVLPYLNYCVEVWGNTYKSNLQPLSALQKRAIRIVSMFQKSYIVKYNTAKIMYKARQNLLPVNIQKLFLTERGDMI